MNNKIDAIDALVWLLFSLRVGVLAIFGVILIWLGYNQPRMAFLMLGFGLVLFSLSVYFHKHPTKPSPSWFVICAVPGLVAFAIGLAVGAA